MPRMLGGLVIVVLGVSCLPGDDPATKRASAAAADVAVAPTEAGLGGKALAVTIKSDPTYGIYLQAAQVQRLGGAEFLVGTGVDSGVGEWSAGRRIWIAIDDISEIVEFQDVDDLRKTLEPENAGPDA